jgi:hypothetical protein
MEFNHQSLIGLYAHSCTQLLTHPILTLSLINEDNYSVSPTRRHLFVTPCSERPALPLNLLTNCRDLESNGTESLPQEIAKAFYLETGRCTAIHERAIKVRMAFIISVL